MTAGAAEAEILQKMNEIRGLVILGITAVLAVATLLFIEVGRVFVGFGVCGLTTLMCSIGFAVLFDGWNRKIWRWLGVDMEVPKP